MFQSKSVNVAVYNFHVVVVSLFREYLNATKLF